VETVEYLLCFCPALCRLRLKHLRSHLIDDLTEISEINFKNISALIKSSGWKTCLTQAETTKNGTLEKEKTRSSGITMDPLRSKCVGL